MAEILGDVVAPRLLGADQPAIGELPADAAHGDDEGFSGTLF
jgi:hypothetical protein